MSNDIVVTEYKSMTQELSVSNQDVESLGNHLTTIKSFVKNQLKDGINADFATIPGTPKKSLLKPGAEKLLKLFGLSTRVTLISKEVDRYENYAEFVYKAEVIHIKSGHLIAECEAMANSWEKKYKENRQGKAMPISDILNTLMKMAQKRAIVGATIIATGASDYFTQDEDEIQVQRENRKPAQVDSSKFTSGSDKDLGKFQVTIGKFKGKNLEEIEQKELVGYCKYITENGSVEGKLKEFIDTAREYLRETGAFAS
jgi:hypothetical protein